MFADTRQAVQYCEYFASKMVLESGSIYYEITYFINSKRGDGKPIPFEPLIRLLRKRTPGMCRQWNLQLNRISGMKYAYISSLRCLRFMKDKVVLSPLGETEGRSRGKGFTLIELLVVIAVVAILVSLLLPVVSRAKQSAHLAVCTSNLRQLGLAMALYVNDMSVYPLYFDYSSKSDLQFWTDRLRPYLQSEWTNRIFKCPGNRKENTGGHVTTDGGIFHLRGSYDMNAYGSAFNEPLGMGFVFNRADGSHRAVRESEVKTPTDFIGFGDVVLFSRWHSSRLDYWAYHSPGLRELRFQGRRDEQRRHRGIFNVVFADSHVEGLDTNQLFGASEDVLRRWNRNNKPPLPGQ